MVVFIGCRLTERKGGTTWKAKVPAKKEEDLLSDFVKSGIRRFRKKDEGVESVLEEDAAVGEAFSRVTSVTCAGYDLTDLLQDPAASLAALNSDDTPIFSAGISIHLSPVPKSTGNAQKKAKTNAIDVMMGKVVHPSLVKDIRFLKNVVNVDAGLPDINLQIQQMLYSLFEEIDLGFYDGRQSDALKGNAELLQNTACFIQKYWKVLLRADFPRIPESDDYSSSKVLAGLSTTIRQKKRV